MGRRKRCAVWHTSILAAPCSYSTRQEKQKPKGSLLPQKNAHHRKEGTEANSRKHGCRHIKFETHTKQASSEVATWVWWDGYHCRGTRNGTLGSFCCCKATTQCISCKKDVSRAFALPCLPGTHPSRLDNPQQPPLCLAAPIKQTFYFQSERGSSILNDLLWRL